LHGCTATRALSAGALVAPRRAGSPSNASSLLCKPQADTAITSLFTVGYSNQSSYAMRGQRVYCGTPIPEYAVT